MATNDQNTELTNIASPGKPGNIKFKCVIWSDCPIYQRVNQDQTFIFSPETMQFSPQSLRNKVITIPGLDGAFLRPANNFYLDNFISFIKPKVKEKTPNPGKKAEESIEQSPYSWNNIIPLTSLEFLGLDNNLTANILSVDQEGNATSSSVGTHQTWISDGSLYSYDNILPSEYDSIGKITDAETRVSKQFCTKWQYRYDSYGKGVGLNALDKEDVFSVVREENRICTPSTAGISVTGDPIQVMRDNACEDKFKLYNGVYSDINPGMHWRMLKRTPVFQGEDFTVEFSVKADSSMTAIKGKNKFRMLEKFYYMDVFGNESSSVCGALNGDGILDEDKNKQIIEGTRRMFDFSNQIYYMVELGVEHALHNYILIIAENSFPILVHVGVVPTLTCFLEEDVQTPAPEKKKDAKTIESCDNSGGEVGGGRSLDGGGTRLKEVTVAALNKFKVLRKLSTYDGASSSTLLNNEKLQINFRQHGGKLIITFSGHEDNPWIIHRKDIDQSLTPITTSNLEHKPISESQVQYKTVDMLIPFGQIALMGGNRKCGFRFAPIIYNSLNNYIMPQTFSIQGPVSADEVQFLWRDKGLSLDPAVSSTLTEAQFTNEAGIYTELYIDPKEKDESKKGKAQTSYTYAIRVQDNFVKNNGKAPDMMVNYHAIAKGIWPSQLWVEASQCTTNQGSTSGDSILMQATISIVPGGYLFPAIDGGNPWPLKDCVTPIVYTLRMHVPAAGSAFSTTPVDVSHHVLSFSDEWSETDWQSMEHSGSISFLMSSGMTFGNNQSNFFYYLADKTFYLNISIWWENGIMPMLPGDLEVSKAKEALAQANKNGNSRQVVIATNALKIAEKNRDNDRTVFTGFCHGGVVTVETNKVVLDCKINDYSKILKDQFFMNSPFFDKMRDVNAVRDILKLAGLKDGEETASSFEPGSLVRILSESESKDGWYNFFFNGDKIYNREYALPGSYDMLQSPFLRFQDGSNFWEAIQKMSLLANKVAFFDRLGVFHFNPLPYDQAIWGGQDGSQTNWTIEDWSDLSKVDFFVTPKKLSPEDSFCADLSSQIIGDYKCERVVQDVMNEIKIISTSPNGEIFVAGHTNYSSLNDPNSPGFIGYRKPFLQMEGIFGSENNVKWMVKNYTKMFIPPLKVSFRALGRNNIKALDVITFRHGSGVSKTWPLIVSSVKSEIDASKNTWFQDFECLWLFPGQNIQWGATNEIGLGLDGSISGL